MSRARYLIREAIRKYEERFGIQWTADINILLLGADEILKYEDDRLGRIAVLVDGVIRLHDRKEIGKNGIAA